jgi:hypothetical protein
MSRFLAILPISRCLLQRVINQKSIFTVAEWNHRYSAQDLGTLCNAIARDLRPRVGGATDVFNASNIEELFLSVLVGFRLCATVVGINGVNSQLRDGTPRP